MISNACDVIFRRFTFPPHTHRGRPKESDVGARRAKIVKVHGASSAAGAISRSRENCLTISQLRDRVPSNACPADGTPPAQISQFVRDSAPVTSEGENAASIAKTAARRACPTVTSASLNARRPRSRLSFRLGAAPFFRLSNSRWVSIAPAWADVQKMLAPGTQSSDF